MKFVEVIKLLKFVADDDGLVLPAILLVNVVTLFIMEKPIFAIKSELKCLIRPCLKP